MLKEADFFFLEILITPKNKKKHTESITIKSGNNRKEKTFMM
jgi:hypothetical protein